MTKGIKKPFRFNVNVRYDDTRRILMIKKKTKFRLSRRIHVRMANTEKVIFCSSCGHRSGSVGSLGVQSKYLATVLCYTWFSKKYHCGNYGLVDIPSSPKSNIACDTTITRIRRICMTYSFRWNKSYSSAIYRGNGYRIITSTVYEIRVKTHTLRVRGVSKQFTSLQISRNYNTKRSNRLGLLQNQT